MARSRTVGTVNRRMNEVALPTRSGREGVDPDWCGAVKPGPFAGNDERTGDCP